MAGVEFPPMEAPSYTTPLTNLRRLFWLRTVMAVVLGAAAWVGAAFFAIPLHPGPAAAALLLMLGFNVFTWWRIRRGDPVDHREMLTQLVLDMAVLTGLFYATGGYTNPFVWMYLLPLTVAAVSLPWRQTWLIAGLAIGCYSFLMFWYLPLPTMPMDMAGMTRAEHMRMMQAGASNGFSVHLLGMWAGFVVSAGVIAFFVERMGRTLREYDRLIAATREKALESERMLALGTLATAAAHELGTPLATMAVVTGELADECANQPQLKESVALLEAQIQRCKHILTSITASAGRERAEGAQRLSLDAFLAQTLEDWSDLHPATQLDARLQGSQPAPLIAVDRTLGQALVNLLDNAADASPERIELAASWSDDELEITLRDFGPGLAPETLARLGTPFFTTKQESGMGLGLYLARLIFERFGGSVSLGNHPQGGAVATVRLPLKELLL